MSVSGCFNLAAYAICYVFVLLFCIFAAVFRNRSDPDPSFCRIWIEIRILLFCGDALYPYIFFFRNYQLWQHENAPSYWQSTRLNLYLIYVAKLINIGEVFVIICNWRIMMQMCYSLETKISGSYISIYNEPEVTTFSHECSKKICNTNISIMNNCDVSICVFDYLHLKHKIIISTYKFQIKNAWCKAGNRWRIACTLQWRRKAERSFNFNLYFFSVYLTIHKIVMTVLYCTYWAPAILSYLLPTIILILQVTSALVETRIIFSRA